eukprot:13421528-Ditylum_brightwellii.AAC.1
MERNDWTEFIQNMQRHCWRLSWNLWIFQPLTKFGKEKPLWFSKENKDTKFTQQVEETIQLTMDT